MAGWVIALAVLASGDFESRGEREGVAMAARPFEGSKFLELRFVTETDGDVAALCLRARGTGALEPGDANVMARTVVRETPTGRVTYEQIAPPLISRRDYVLRLEVAAADPSGCHVVFESITDPEVPERAGWLRVRRLAGTVNVKAIAPGRVRVEHTVHFDPGGSLPAWLIEPGREKAGVAWVRHFVRK